MTNDFRNFAVNHLGMSSNTLDGYVRHINSQAASVNTTALPSADYLNPYILEERQLNVTQMDVFSRLMMDRIIFMRHRLPTGARTSYRLSSFISTLPTLTRTFRSISTHPAVLYMPVRAYMTLCSM